MRLLLCSTVKAFPLQAGSGWMVPLLLLHETEPGWLSVL